MDLDDLIFRNEIRPEDPGRIEAIVVSSGYFRADEVKVAMELAEERLATGTASGYEFIFAELDGITLAYSCFGLIPCTLHSYDLYWIATHGEFRHRGIGRKLLVRTELAIAELGGTGIYVETSSQELYAPTRSFYLKNGYTEKARYEDFYDRGDDKIVYVKKLPL